MLSFFFWREDMLFRQAPKALKVIALEISVSSGASQCAFPPGGGWGGIPFRVGRSRGAAGGRGAKRSGGLIFYSHKGFPDVFPPGGG